MDELPRVEPRVVLEPLTPRRTGRIQMLASDLEVARTCWIPHPLPASAARRWIEELIGHEREGRARWFAVLAPGRSLVGMCGLDGVDGSRRSGHLSYWIGRPHWGRGYATSAARQVMSLARDELRLATIYSCVLGSNHRSRRVLEKLAFRLLYSEPNLDARFSPAESKDHYRAREGTDP